MALGAMDLALERVDQIIAIVETGQLVMIGMICSWASRRELGICQCRSGGIRVGTATAWSPDPAIDAIADRCEQDRERRNHDAHHDRHQIATQQECDLAVGSMSGNAKATNAGR
jgi:hypothetical protein